MATASPHIVARGAWGANPLSTPAATIATPTPELWLHHTASSGLHGASGMRSLQQGALAGGYVDLEYSIVVDNDGQLYMSRGIGRDPAATGGRNSISHAICAMGNYENDAVSDRLLDGIVSAVLWLHAQGGTARPAVTGPHRDAPNNATACCGRNLIALIPEINKRAAGGSSSPPAGGGNDVPGDKEFVSRLVTPEGAWDLQYDGGVRTVRGPFYGSYFSLPSSVRNDPARRFRVLAAPADGSARGYDLISTKGESYAMRTKNP